MLAAPNQPVGHVSTWTCPTCGVRCATPYCSKCGEQQLRPGDLTARDLLKQLLEWLSAIDGRLIRTIRLLICKPGALTAAHIAGQRKAFLRPLQLFLVANALFFAAQSATDINILSSSLDSHLHQQDWSTLARTLVTRELATKGTDLVQYAPVFDNAVVLNAKMLIILMCVAFVPALAPFSYRTRRPVGVHVVFSLHLYSFILLLFCLSLALAEAHMWAGGGGLTSPHVDLVLSISNLSAGGLYLYLALAIVYKMTGVARLLAAGVLSCVVAIIVIGYRFVMLILTLYTT